jgi:hypothetical protein
MQLELEAVLWSGRRVAGVVNGGTVFLYREPAFLARAVCARCLVEVW